MAVFPTNYYRDGLRPVFKLTVFQDNRPVFSLGPDPANLSITREFSIAEKREIRRLVQTAARTFPIRLSNVDRNPPRHQANPTGFSGGERYIVNCRICRCYLTVRQSRLPGHFRGGALSKLYLHYRKHHPEIAATAAFRLGIN